MKNIQEIAIAEYDYPLPDERIAKYPLAERDTSKLLLYNKGTVCEDSFSSLPNYIPQGALMVFNNTKVIQARLRFRKETGATIEVFCLEPEQPCDYQQIFLETKECVWQCLVGNSNRWKGGVLSQTVAVGGKDVTLSVERVGGPAAVNHVRFFWDGGCSFAELLEALDKIDADFPSDYRRADLDHLREGYAMALRDGRIIQPAAPETVLTEIDGKDAASLRKLIIGTITNILYGI